MTLSELYYSGKYNTDRNTDHSYIDHFYNETFSGLSNVSNILEIGVCGGGGIMLWKDHFKEALIDCIDIDDYSSYVNHERINFIQSDAYCLQTFWEVSSKSYDIIIDDGPHTLSSQIFFLQNYLNLVKPGGLAIIEDIQSDTWFSTLSKNVPAGYTYSIIDLRPIKGRYDDMIFFLRKDS
jgi:2-polyprenyl-3-methyl-5-hydroxy-6-metoxy-1,4-benzoquinol methylase